MVKITKETWRGMNIIRRLIAHVPTDEDCTAAAKVMTLARELSHASFGSGDAWRILGQLRAAITQIEESDDGNESVLSLVEENTQ